MVISKDLISSPLEAGPSLLDSQKLPLPVIEALGYVSSRLIRKHLHLTFVVVRDPQQYPQVLGPVASHSPPHLTTPSLRSPSLSSFSRRYLPCLSVLPRLPMNPSSLSPNSPSPALTLHITTPQPQNSYNISLLHAQPLSPKVARYVSQSIVKASKKYSAGDSWLVSPMSPTSPAFPVSPAIPVTPLTPVSPITPTSPLSPMSPLPPTSPTSPTINPASDIVRRSLLQNNIIFSTEGLTLLSLDRVYALKVSLSVYARALSQRQSPNSPSSSDREEEVALTNAVESLRLLILFQNGRCITKSYLLRAYDHISVSTDALKRVNQAYKKEFKTDAIHGMELDAPKQLLSWRARRSKLGRSKLGLAGWWGGATSEAEKPPVNLGLKLNTNIVTDSQKAEEAGMTRSRMSPRLELPTSPDACAWYRKAEDDGVLIVDGIQRLDTRSYFGGPKTPKHLDDVTPITRGEWHWLMSDRPRMAAVETC